MNSNSNITGIFIVAPSTIQAGETFSLKVRVLTDPYEIPASTQYACPSVHSRFNLSPRGAVYMENVPLEWQGSLIIEGPDGYEGPRKFTFDDNWPGSYSGDRRPIASIDSISLKKTGVFFIKCADPESGITGLSNAIEVVDTKPIEKLYWGDTHSQTIFSDGLRCPEELFYFAREEAFLDFFSLADHTERITDYQWEYFINVTNGFNDPSNFATMIGQEWTCHKFGHRNIYFRGDSGPILRHIDPNFDNLEKLFSAARKEKALVIPHHTSNARMGCDWSLGHDPQVERLVEIYSLWGSSELPASQGNTRPLRANLGEVEGRHVIDALKLGYRFGFIGSGDIHDGRPGDCLHRHHSHPPTWPLHYDQGIVGVWADNLTRESLFDALWNRRCYATTGVRILAKFEVNGQPMGSELPVTNETVNLKVETASPTPIKKIEIIRNGKVICTEVSNKQYEIFQTNDKPADETFWYYARVILEDGNMAWTSPVWVG